MSLKEYFSIELRLLVDCRYAFTLFVSVIPKYTHFLGLHLLAVMSYETLKWTVDDVSYFCLTALAGGLLNTVLVVVLSKRLADCKMLVVQNCVTLIPMAFIMMIPTMSNASIQAILIYVSAFLLGVVDASCHILSISMISKIVSADHQAIGEAIRLIIFFIAYAVSGFGTSAIFYELFVGGGIILFINIVGLVMLIFYMNCNIENRE